MSSQALESDTQELPQEGWEYIKIKEEGQVVEKDAKAEQQPAKKSRFMHQLDNPTKMVGTMNFFCHLLANILVTKVSFQFCTCSFFHPN